jgi:alkylation response protein AidB-like acyl-CoA dehydrogenase
LAKTLTCFATTTRDFSDDKIAPRADEIDKTNTFPRDLWPQMGALGLHGITVEEEYGGSGMGYLAHCVAMEEISRGSPRSACPTARIPTCASIRSGATAPMPSARNTCRS